MILNLLDSNIAKVLIVFSLAPGARFRRKEIKEKTRLNNVNLDKALTILQNSKILLREDNYFKLNLSEETKALIGEIQKEYKKLNEIPLNVFFSILDLTKKASVFKNIRIYLFGSYAKLTFKEGSDVDLAIIPDRSLENLEKYALKLEKKYKVKLQLHFFDKEFFKHKEDPLVREIIKNGIQIVQS